jgi:ATP-dependent Clp protease, protease subunit
MPKHPIRVFDGVTQPYDAFWQWNPVNAAGEPELSFYGYISEFSWLEDDITPKKFQNDLKSFGKNGPITIRMHSGGGEIFAAHAIASMLRDYPGKKTVIIDGLCASAAVMVALSADKVKIQDAAYMMVHNPGYGSLWGWMDAGTLRQYADMLDTFRNGMLDAYANRTQKSREELAALLDAETWMTATEAVAAGFADEVLTGGKPIKAQQIALKNFVNVPGELLNFTSEIQPDPQAIEIEREAQSLRDYLDVYLIKETTA